MSEKQSKRKQELTQNQQLNKSESQSSEVFVEGEEELRKVVSLGDVDFDEYRKKVDNRAVKKNCTIPYWMSVEAEKANINYSKILQEALAKQLNLVHN